MGLSAIIVTWLAGCAIAYRGLGIRQLSYSLPIGTALSLALFLLGLYLLVTAGIPLEQAGPLASTITFGIGTWSHLRPSEPRYARQLGNRELAILLLACVVVWLFTNLGQSVAVDDDYWLHTPIQKQLARGDWPPTNPYFPELELGGHFSRDLLIVGASKLTETDIFQAQILVTSFCHSLGLLLLYLALRSEGNASSATVGTAMIWLGMNVSGRVGLMDFYQNNGALTYFLIALLLSLLLWLWRLPATRYVVASGLLLALLGLVYESHFGLLVLSLMSLLPVFEGAARRATLGVLLIGVSLAVIGGGALSRLALPGTTLEKSLANQSQTVQMSFPKTPFLGLRIDANQAGPVSIGYRIGIGRPLLWLLDHVPSRVNDRYVRLWSWMVLRMHWVGLWIAPLSAWLLWRSQNRAGMFLWLFGLWAYLVPGLVNFGEVHEYEWLRWEFAAAFGFAGAAGIALGQIVWGRRAATALVLSLVLLGSAGLNWTWERARLVTTVSPGQLLGRVDTQDWLLRHGEHLRLEESDLRLLDWISVNPEQGRGAFVASTPPTRPWDILFESTAMGLVDIHALGHELPPDSDPIGLPPYRIRQSYKAFLSSPQAKVAKQLGIDWIVVRSNDLELERSLLSEFPKAIFDGRGHDGRRRYLFRTQDSGGLKVPPAPDGVKYRRLKLPKAPTGADYAEVMFPQPAAETFRLRGHLPAVESEITLLVPSSVNTVDLRFVGEAEGKTLRIELDQLP